MKIRSAEELQNIIDQDFAWRKKELALIFSNVKTSKPLLLQTNLRIGIVILYAHWEGFIKNTSESYLMYVACKRLKFSELRNNFIALCLKNNLKEYVLTNKNTIHTQMVDFLLGDLNIRASVPTENIIKTNSNLNSITLREILSTIGIEYSDYELKEKLIDSQLLNLRNNVAHGQEVEIDEDEFENLFKEITSMMEGIKNEVLNSAILSGFKK